MDKVSETSLSTNRIQRLGFMKMSPDKTRLIVLFNGRIVLSSNDHMSYRAPSTVSLKRGVINPIGLRFKYFLRIDIKQIYCIETKIFNFVNFDPV